MPLLNLPTAKNISINESATYKINIFLMPFSHAFPKRKTLRERFDLKQNSSFEHFFPETQFNETNSCAVDLSAPSGHSRAGEND